MIHFSPLGCIEFYELFSGIHVMYWPYFLLCAVPVRNGSCRDAVSWLSAEEGVRGEVVDRGLRTEGSRRSRVELLIIDVVYTRAV